MVIVLFVEVNNTSCAGRGVSSTSHDVHHVDTKRFTCQIEMMNGGAGTAVKVSTQPGEVVKLPIEGNCSSSESCTSCSSSADASSSSSESLTSVSCVMNLFFSMVTNTSTSWLFQTQQRSTYLSTSCGYYLHGTKQAATRTGSTVSAIMHPFIAAPSTCKP